MPLVGHCIRLQLFRESGIWSSTTHGSPAHIIRQLKKRHHAFAVWNVVVVAVHLNCVTRDALTVGFDQMRRLVPIPEFLPACCTLAFGAKILVEL